MDRVGDEPSEPIADHGVAAVPPRAIDDGGKDELCLLANSPLLRCTSTFCSAALVPIGVSLRVGTGAAMECADALLMM